MIQLRPIPTVQVFYEGHQNLMKSQFLQVRIHLNCHISSNFCGLLRKTRNLQEPEIYKKSSFLRRPRIFDEISQFI